MCRVLPPQPWSAFAASIGVRSIVFARRKGHSEHDAQDLTQGFLAELLAKNPIARAEPSRGRFRSFLLAAFCNCLANQRREQVTRKLGCGRLVTSHDDD